MGILPYTSFELQTDLTPGEVWELLDSVTHDGPNQFFRRDTDWFYGTCDPEDFYLRLIQIQGNMLNAEIIGHVDETPQGSRIRVRMWPNMGGLLATGFALVVTGAASLDSLGKYIAGLPGADPWWPVGFVAFAVAAPYYFWSDARHARRVIETLFAPEDAAD